MHKATESVTCIVKSMFGQSELDFPVICHHGAVGLFQIAICPEEIVSAKSWWVLTKAIDDTKQPANSEHIISNGFLTSCRHSFWSWQGTNAKQMLLRLATLRPNVATVLAAWALKTLTNWKWKSPPRFSMNWEQVASPMERLRWLLCTASINVWMTWKN